MTGTPVDRLNSGLWVPRAANLLRYRAVKRTVTLRSGERALVSVDDSGTATQVETAERLDAIVRPRTIRYRLRRGA